MNKQRTSTHYKYVYSIFISIHPSIPESINRTMLLLPVPARLLPAPPLLPPLPPPPLLLSAAAPAPPAHRCPPAPPRAVRRLSLTFFPYYFLHTIVPRTRFFSSATVIRTSPRSRRRNPSDPRGFDAFEPRGARCPRCTRCSSITTRSNSRGSSFSNKLSSFYDETPR